MMQRKDTVIIITDYPFNKRDYDRFGIERLRSHSLTVEIWDITGYLHPEFKDKLVREDQTGFTGLRTFTIRDEVVRAIAGLDGGCLINCFFGYTHRSVHIFREITKFHIDYCVFAQVTYPSPTPVKQNFLGRCLTLIKKGRNLKIREIIEHIADKTLLKHHHIFGIAPASLVLFLGGEKSEGIYAFPVDASTKRLWAHYLDYDIVLGLRDEPLSMDGKTGVFLDQYLPLHPDSLYMGIGFPLTPDDYYPKICRFFDLIEQKTGARIIVAAHPRADYDNAPDYFCGRTIAKGESARLARKSSFVIAHTSTSIDFAVLYCKPLIFLTTDALQGMVTGKNIIGIDIRAMSSELGKTPVNLDHLDEGIDWDAVLRVDEELYRRYITNFIKKEDTPERPVWDIFSAYIMHKPSP